MQIAAELKEKGDVLILSSWSWIKFDYIIFFAFRKWRARSLHHAHEPKKILTTTLEFSPSTRSIPSTSRKTKLSEE